ncbi:MAG: DUF4129 domain-containing protein [Pseudomonadota bacterium]
MSITRGHRCIIALMACVLCLSGPVSAEITEEDLEPTGAPNSAYTDAVWGRNIQSKIVYIRPEVDFKADKQVKIKVPDPEEEERTPIFSNRFIIGVFLAFVLAVILYVFIVNSNAVGVSFRKTGEARRSDGCRDEGASPEDISSQPLDAFLAGLAAMADKREALILLVSRALERAADLNGLRLARAQTARDVLRVLPSEWAHMKALRGLVREAEIVHFGGRDLSPEKWDECFSAAQPIFRGGTA